MRTAVLLSPLLALPAAAKPELLWKMEVDCFRAGDEKASALHMLDHLADHLGHKLAPKWIEEFQKLVKGQNPKRPPAE